MPVVTCFGEIPGYLELPFHIRVAGPDQGLILAWHVGRQMGRDDPSLKLECQMGRFPPKLYKVGTLEYLAQWQGIRGDILHIDTERTIDMLDAGTGAKVVFTRMR